MSACRFPGAWCLLEALKNQCATAFLTASSESVRTILASAASLGVRNWAPEERKPCGTEMRRMPRPRPGVVQFGGCLRQGLARSHAVLFAGVHLEEHGASIESSACPQNHASRLMNGCKKLGISRGLNVSRAESSLSMAMALQKT